MQTDPAWTAAVREFQEYFGEYFPNLLDDEGAAETEMAWLESRVFGNPMQTVRRARAKDELAKIRVALSLMARHDTFSYDMRSLFAAATVHDDEVAAKVHEILEFLSTLAIWRDEGKLDEVLNRFIAEAEKAIEATPDTGNTNWDAVHAIDGLRNLWWRNTGQDGPHALNPASRFAAFLKRGFEYLEIEGDHISAFRRWSAIKSE